MEFDDNQGLNPFRDDEQRMFLRGDNPYLEFVRNWYKAKRLQEQRQKDDRAASYPYRNREIADLDALEDDGWDDGEWSLPEEAPEEERQDSYPSSSNEKSHSGDDPNEYVLYNANNDFGYVHDRAALDSVVMANGAVMFGDLMEGPEENVVFNVDQGEILSENWARRRRYYP